VDRALSIALLCAAFAAVAGYCLRDVVRTGETMLVQTPVRRIDSPGDFWAIVGFVAVLIGAAAIASVVYFVEWILG
jgi:hypothetical protein